MAQTRVKAKANGIFSPNGFKQYAKRLERAKNLAYTKAIPEAVKETKQELGNKARGVFDVKSKTFNQMFTAKKYDKKVDRLPAVLFYTRSHYFSVFENGATIKAKNAKGLFIPFVQYNNRSRNASKGIAGKKTNFMKNLERLRSEGKTFWKKINGKLILFAFVDNETRKPLRDFRRNFAKKHSLKQVKTGTAIPIGILLRSVRIKKRFDFSNIAKNTFVPKVVKSFESNLDISQI